MSAASRSNFEKSYLELAEKMQFIGWDDPKTNILRLVKKNLESARCNEWLMIIDNADDMHLFFGTKQNQLEVVQADSEATEPLFNFIPQESQGLILYTTRSKSDAHKLLAGNGNPIGIDRMGTEEAKMLFKNKIGAAWESKIESTELLEQLLEELEYLPLAVVQAASYICEIELCTVSSYLADYRRGTEGKWSFLSHETRLRGREQSVSQSVLRTWIITFTMLRQIHNKATEYLCMMAFLNRQDIPLYLLKEESETLSSFFEAINPLIAYSFISANENKDSFSFHRLVQLSTKYWVQLQGESSKWCNAGLYALSQHFPYDINISKIANQLFPHVQSALENNRSAEVDREARGVLLTVVSMYLVAKGDYQSSVVHGEMAVADTRAHFGDLHEKALTSIHTLSRALQAAGNYSAAERYVREAIKGREGVLGENHRDTLASQALLACVADNQGKYEEALKISESLHERSQELFGEEDRDTIEYGHDLGWAYKSLGQFALAEKYLRQAVEGRHNLLGPHHRATLESMYQLGVNLVNQGKVTEAKGMLQMVLQGRSQLLGEHHPNVYRVLRELAWILHLEQRHDEACQLYHRVLALQETSMGQQHPDTLYTMQDLATVLEALGNLDEAELLYRQGLNIQTTELGADHPDSLISMYNLALLLHDQERYPEAEELLRQSLKLEENRNGEEHRELLQTLDRLESFASKREEQNESMQLLQRIAGIGKKAKREGLEIRENQKRIIEDALWKLADIHYGQESFTEAEELLQQRLSLNEETYGKDHIRLLYTLDYLITIHKERGEQHEVVHLSQRIAEIGMKARREGLEMAECQKEIIVYTLERLREQGQLIESTSKRQGAFARFRQKLSHRKRV